MLETSRYMTSNPLKKSLKFPQPLVKNNQYLLYILNLLDSINWLVSYSLHKQIIAACSDGSIRMFSNITGDLERSITDIGAGQAYLVASCSKDQTLIAAAFEDRSIRVFNYANGEVFTKIEEAHTGMI